LQVCRQRNPDPLELPDLSAGTLMSADMVSAYLARQVSDLVRLSKDPLNAPADADAVCLGIAES
jgi:hypothetical protein